MINHTSANVGNINLFRYRGYYYDTETKLYYLNARYYDPQIKRFISADHVNYLGANGDLNSCNLYAYCSNNPVMYVDPTGEIAWEIVLLVAFFIIATVNDIYEITTGEEVKPTVSENGETVTIQNSYNVITPWVQYGYSFYLNHINDKTKDVIQGTTFGIYYEWAIHNLACDVGTTLGIESLVEAGRHLSVGATVFNDYDRKFDKNNARDWFSLLMGLEYLFFGTPAIIDYHIYKGGIK